jgi:glutamyl-tRNA reductase
MNRFHLVSFHFERLPLPILGKLFQSPEQKKNNLPLLLEKNNATELMYLATCNRIECLFVSTDKPCPYKTALSLNHALTADEVAVLARGAAVYSGSDAVRHFFSTTSSLNSMVIGEREIITQVRKAHEEARAMGLSGDFIRLLVKRSIETAKHIYTHTNIAKKPVSVVSLAFTEIKKRFTPSDARILIVGAGNTNTNMVRLLVRNGFSNIVVTNRTDTKAVALAEHAGCSFMPWKNRHEMPKDFNLVISCTGSELPVITNELFANWTRLSRETPLLVDLAMPADAEDLLIETCGNNYISLVHLKQLSEWNIELRKSQIQHCLPHIESAVEAFGRLVRERLLEVALRDVPEMVREIRELALNTVFAREISEMNDQNRMLMERILDYMEKKYIALPIKKAKELLLEQAAQDAN